jgi:DNA-binding transcriptional LysR family regulator
MPTPDRIRLFARVVEEGSFSAAARTLGVAPTSISRQVATLERELGARLFNRTTRTRSITEAGSVYYERIKQILGEIDEANRAVSQVDGAPRGTLRVTAPVTLGRQHIVPALPQFLARFPNVQVELALTDSIVDLVEQGYDAAVRIGAVRNGSLVARRLASSDRVICASPAYLKRAGAPRHPRDLAHHNCLAFEPKAGYTPWRLAGPDGSHAVRVAGNFSTNSADGLLGTARAGLGIVRLPSWLAADDLRRRRLRVVLNEWRDADGPTPIYVLYAHNRLLAPKIRAFVDYFVDCFARWPLTATDGRRRRRA